MRTIHVVLSALVPMAMVALAGACGDPEVEAAVRALGEGCLIDSDCDGSLVCVFRRCHVQCETDKDCEDADLTTRCSTEQPKHVCLLPDEVECERHSDCPSPDMVCFEASCRDRCVSDDNCNVDSSCSTIGTCEPEETPIEDPGLGSVPPGGLCSYNSQCEAPLVCLGGFCEAQCLADIDCPEGKACDTSAGPGVCVTPGSGGTPAHCQNGVLDADESDVDCGGSCVACPSGADCTAAPDCASGVCTSALCQAPACDDGVRNGFESGLDCGGPQCSPCPVGQGCTQPSDCAPGDVCDAGSGVCVGPDCLDGVQNGDETDVDCGGSCGACDTTQNCVTPGDCSSLVCVAGACQPPACNDGVQNEDETDVDCGGTVSGCAACDNGGGCAVATDCSTLNCTLAGSCAPPACDDGVQNGLELGQDCGGGCPNGCAVGTTCNVDGDCVSTAGCHPVSGMCTTRFNLQVTYAGGGQGNVATSAPANLLDCNGTCNAAVFENESVTLDATALGGSTFDGFTGDCVGNPSCTFMIAADANVTATFSPGAQLSPRWLENFSNLQANNEMEAFAVDSQNHVYFGGRYQGTRTFGGLQVSPSGSFDSFIVKYNDDGTADWALSEGGPGGASTFHATTALGVDANDDVLAGYMFTVTPNPTFGNKAHTCPVGAFVVAKFSPAGAPIWSECRGQGATTSRVRAIAADSNGDVLVAGEFDGTMDLGEGANEVSNGVSWFLARYAGADGSVIAGETFTFAADSFHNFRQLQSVEVRGSDVLLTGHCVHGDTIGGMMMDNAQGGDSLDICVAKLAEADLTATWVRGIGGTADDGANRAVFANNDRVIVGGWFRNAISFVDGTLNAVADRDMIFVELDAADGTLFNPTGGASWDGYGTAGLDEIVDIAVTATGVVYGIGNMTDGLDFNPADGEAPLIGRNVVVKFGSFGNYAGALSTGDPSGSFAETMVSLRLMSGGALVFSAFAGTAGPLPDWGSPTTINNSEQYIQSLTL